MKDLYETKISDTRWIAYDIPGNVGWIIYFVCCYRLTKRGISGYMLFALVPAVLMLIGIVELISERILKLDRVLPKKRLWRGFGALTMGGVLGAAAAAAGLLFQEASRLPLWMLAGSALCAVFAGLLFAGYKRQ